MRLSDWRKTAPHKECLSTKVLAVLRTVLVDLGADEDPECWVAWGEDAETRYSVLVPATAGVIYVAVRLTGSEEGPRATARLIRWSKLTVSELSVDAAGSHRIVAVQVESLVLKGTDDEADRICEFVRGLIASVDNRIPQAIPIAVLGGAVVGGAVAAHARADTKAQPAGSARPPRPAAKPVGVAAAAKAPAPSRPKAPIAGTKTPIAGPKAPIAGKKAPIAPAASKTGAKSPARSAAPVPERPAPGALVPVAQPAASKPIAERAAAAHHGGQPAGAPTRPANDGPESSADRSEWVSPHPIEEPREPNRPRPWTP
jgi:hypothetical protein